MKTALRIAIRFLASNRTQTVFIVIGIAIGISVQIFIGLLIQGLQKSLIDAAIGNSSQITVTSKKDDPLFASDQSLLDAAKTADSRITVVSPVLDRAAFLRLSSTRSPSVLVKGMDLTKANKIYQLSSHLKSGRMPTGADEVMLGLPFHTEDGVSLGDTLTLIKPDRTTAAVTVVGFFDEKVSQINQTWCVTTLANAQSLFGANGKITSLDMQIQTAHVFGADAIASNVSKKLNDTTLKTESWKTENQQLLSGLQGQSISSIMIQIFVLVSVVLGIASVLAISVSQKSRQIGILKAMGLKNRQTSMIFLSEGLLLGIAGAVAGIALGIGLLESFSTFARNSDGSVLVPIILDPKFIAVSGLIALAACVLASLIPARQSALLDPIDIIRNN